MVGGSARMGNAGLGSRAGWSVLMRRLPFGMTSTHRPQIRPALSTVACADWTLPCVASVAGAAGYHGVELRTHGFGATEMVCDPMLSDAAKVRRTLEHNGVVPMCLATTIGFDKPIFPPVLGHARDNELSVRQAQRVIDFASAMGCPFVRVFAAESGRAKLRGGGPRLIVKRVRLAAERCRGLGVQLLIENSGPFASASTLAGLLDQVDLPRLVGASYSVAAGQAAGDRVSEAVALLGERLHVVRLADQKDGRSCPLGRGELGVADVLDSLRNAGYGGWVVNEYDRLNQPELAETDEAIEGGPALILVGAGQCLQSQTKHHQAVAV